MKQPSVKTRKDLFGRDVKVTRNKDVKTKEVTGNYVAKTKVVKGVKGGSKVTKSRMEVDPSMGYGSVRNVTKYTGLAGLKKELDTWHINPLPATAIIKRISGGIFPRSLYLS